MSPSGRLSNLHGEDVQTLSKMLSSSTHHVILVSNTGMMIITSHQHLKCVRYGIETSCLTLVVSIIGTPFLNRSLGSSSVPWRSGAVECGANPSCGVHRHQYSSLLVTSGNSHPGCGYCRLSMSACHCTSPRNHHSTEGRTVTPSSLMEVVTLVRATGLAIRRGEFKFAAGVRARRIVLTDCTSRL